MSVQAEIDRLTVLRGSMSDPAIKEALTYELKVLSDYKERMEEVKS